MVGCCVGCYRVLNTATCVYEQKEVFTKIANDLFEAFGVVLWRTFVNQLGNEFFFSC